MKKISLLAAICCLSSTASLAPLASADTIFGIYAGVGTWQTDYSGEIGDPAVSTNDLGMTKNNNNYFYVALEHPIPIIPNVKFQQQNISSSQTGTISENFIIDGVEYTAGEEVASDLDLSSSDITLYYEILDNWINLDVGLTARKYSGYLSAESTSESNKVDVDQVVPMLYGKFEFDLPFTGFAIGAEGNYISLNNSKISDFSGKISYLFDSALDLGVELGYKSMTLTIDEDGAQTDLQLKGPYAAAILHF